MFMISKFNLESSIHIAFRSEKVILSESGEKYAQIKHHLQAKTVQNKYCMSEDFNVSGQKGGSVMYYGH